MIEQVAIKRSKPRFCDNFVAEDEDLCWEWTGARANKKGYGSFFGERAHRFSFKHYGKRDLRPGEHVLHTCDNPRCVNPNHLYTGDNNDNIKDKMNRGRYKVPRSMTARCSCLICHQEKQVASFAKHYRHCAEVNHAC